MPDRSRVMTQTKRDTLVLQVGGTGLTTPHGKKLIVTKVDGRPKPTVGCSGNGRRRYLDAG
jgi:hypothetical protein